MKNLGIKLIALLFAATSISTTLVTAAEMNLAGNGDPLKACTGNQDRKRDRLQQKDPNCVPKKDGTGKKNKKGNKNKKSQKKMNKKGNGNKQGKGR
ncbi:MAG TPA: hypothetical protein PKE39_10900 [Ignavibacteria bacterium]|nr:hypothetical protein [Ignavibacteria bacterium]HMQ99522.1 hypothetical protein [Ignavibacteria bacterium]